MTFDVVKKIVDEWDPLQLLAICCPRDEYDDISRKICECEGDYRQLGKQIYEIFLDAFGKNSFDETLDACQNIAKTILEVEK